MLLGLEVLLMMGIVSFLSLLLLFSCLSGDYDDLADTAAIKFLRASFDLEIDTFFVLSNWSSGGKLSR